MKKIKICQWYTEEEEEDDCYDTCYDTSCGHSFFMEFGNLKENNFKFCIYCGGKIKLEKEAENENKEEG